ncbi:MAG: GspH/FimT family pseudopilin [Acinetobacter sp.]|nr:GspH/FimT family pseudopilin [Acinetobacter sp.]
MKYNAAGFTLLELLIVIFIIAVLSSLALPYYQNVKAKQEMYFISDAFPMLFRIARQEAFTRHQDIVICPSYDGERCSANTMAWEKSILVFVDLNQNRQKDQKDALLQRQDLNIRYARLSYSGARHANYLMFKQNNALPQGSQGSFYYCSTQNASLHRRIVLSAMGHSRVEQNVESCSL